MLAKFNICGTKLRSEKHFASVGVTSDITRQERCLLLQTPRGRA